MRRVTRSEACRIVVLLGMILAAAASGEGWTDADIGSPPAMGSSHWLSSASVAVSGSGAGDNGHFVHQRVIGDFALTASIAVLPRGGRCGLLVREGLGPEARYEMISVGSDGVVHASARQQGSMLNAVGEGDAAKPLPIRLRAARWGDEIALTVDELAPATPPRIKDHATLRHLAETVEVGFFVCSDGAAVPAEARFDEVALRPLDLPYRTSWIGNSQAGSFKAVQQQVQSLSIDADAGRVWLNADGDEGDKWAAAYALADGEQLTSVEKSKVRRSGHGVAATPDGIFLTGSEDGEQFVFRCDPVGRFSRIPKADAKGHLRLVGHGGEVLGLAADPQRREVYVSDTAADRIRVFDTQLRPLRDLPVARPGALALDPAGWLWAVQRAGAVAGPSIRRFAPDGAPADVRIGGVEDPQGLAVAPDGRLWVAESGRRSQLLVFERDGRECGSFGAAGGILARTAGTRPGEVHPLKLNRPVAVGFAPGGDIIVASNPGEVKGTELRRLRPDGSEVWSQYGLEFMDIAAPVPGSDGVELVSDSHAYRIDYARGTGQEWSYAAYTIDRFAYPEDPRLWLKMTGAQVCRIAGHPILFTTTTMGDGFAAFRYAADSAIAIPALMLRAQSKKGRDSPAESPAAAGWAWRDADGDGRMQAAEFSLLPDEAVRFRIVDEAGTIWSVAKDREAGFARLPCQGLDALGIPRYDPAHPEEILAPAPLTEVGRVFHDVGSDTMYLGGYTAAQPREGREWKQFGRVVCAYPRWSAGNRTAALTLVLPYAPKSKAGHDSFSAQNLWVAGDFIFVSISATGEVLAYERGSGRLRQIFTPGPEVGGRTGLIDLPYGLNAFRRSDGEYVILVESNDQAKILMYRWRP